MMSVITAKVTRRPRGRPRKNLDQDSSSSSTSKNQDGSKISLKNNNAKRARKERKLYTDDWSIGDEIDDSSVAVFSIAEKLDSPKFAQNFVKEMNGADFNLAYLQKYGFSTPVVFKDKTGLGLQVPGQSFTVNDVRTCVGSRRILDVMDVSTQKNFEMSMKEWQRYYEEPMKERLLNVISLEFSHTRLENYIRPPSIVRQIDWVDCVWPRHLKELQRESTNALDEMMYPKVQKYCLMSVKGCYTDFHIDFGGTSVWYHILKGSKIFWLIPPTETNIRLYEQWVLSGKQSDIFFGDTVEKCGRILLHEGNTFFIPTGWIHAVYTLKDSLVFGGNFLHSYCIEKQLRIAEVEDTTHVPQKFRYPFFTEMLWYVLERYVYCLLGNSHLNIDPDLRDEITINPSHHVHLTPFELHGLKSIIRFVHTLPQSKKCVPPLMRDAVLLIKDVRNLIELHCHDNPEAAITGRPTLIPQAKPARFQHDQHDQHDQEVKIEEKIRSRTIKAISQGPRRRRTRCKTCMACRQPDCGECAFCKDMVKFGGLGKAKQTCVARQCLQPLLPVTACCSVCTLDGWGQQIVIPIQKVNKDTPSSLMECSVCYEIIHQDCMSKLEPDAEGIVNEDLPNSWECPKCCTDGRNREYKPRHFRARKKSSDLRGVSGSSTTSSCRKVIEIDSDTSGSESDDVKPLNIIEHHHSPNKRRKQTFPTSMNGEMRKKSPSTLKLQEDRPGGNAKRQPEEITPSSSGGLSCGSEPRKLALRAHLANQLSSNSTKCLKRPLYAVRPAGSSNKQTADDAQLPHCLSKCCLVPVFKYLNQSELATCALVCQAWSTASIDPCLWKRVDVTSKRLTGPCLAGIARRQPEMIIMDWTGIAKRQLEWLITRIPQLRELSLQGCSWNGVAALRSCVCPPLTSLDVSFVTGMNDAALRDILSPPKNPRPGLVDTKSRLRNLRTLKLAGCEISDISLRYIVQNTPSLTTLDLSQCFRLTDAGIAQLTTSPATTVNTLQWIDLSGCTSITDVSVEYLGKCSALRHLDLRHTTQVTTNSVHRFVMVNRDFSITDEKLLTRDEI